MAFTLAAEAITAGYALSAYDSVGSTMTEARALALGGDPGPRWFAARRQSEGRGRRGKTWATPQGNLAASLLWPLPGTTPADAATLAFVAGIAVRDAIADLADPAVARRLGLKWPNDVLADGAKLAGILLELETFPAGQSVIVGIGVNVREAPTGLPYAATSLSALGCGGSPEDLFTALSAAWVRAAQAWDGGRGFARVRETWLRHAVGVGRGVTVASGRQVLEGIFETIDEAGRLVLRGADGALRHVAAGEVHFGTAASAA